MVACLATTETGMLADHCLVSTSTLLKRNNNVWEKTSDDHGALSLLNMDHVSMPTIPPAPRRLRRPQSRTSLTCSVMPIARSTSRSSHLGGETPRTNLEGAQEPE